MDDNDVALRVSAFKAWLRKLMDAQGRDDSHGMRHFEEVRKVALQLAEEAGSTPAPCESLILQLAALCHDVLDHKYMGAAETMEEVRRDMKAALRDLSGLDPVQVDDVCLIAENISLSLELSGKLQTEALQSRGLEWLRNLVSDADKLDALGAQGLRRLVQFQAHSLASRGLFPGLLSPGFVREMAKNHLLHRANYLRTSAAIFAGDRLVRETSCIIASDAALQRIIDNVLLADMTRKATERSSSSSNLRETEE